MSAESVLYSILSSAPSVSELVGSGASARIYPDAMPEGTAYPVVVFSRAGTQPITTIDGIKHGEFATLSLQCWALTRASADALGDAIEAGLLSAGELADAREGAFDPEAGLFATTITTTLFV